MNRLLFLLLLFLSRCYAGWGQVDYFNNVYWYNEQFPAGLWSKVFVQDSTYLSIVRTGMVDNDGVGWRSVSSSGIEVDADVTNIDFEFSPWLREDITRCGDNGYIINTGHQLNNEFVIDIIRLDNNIDTLWTRSMNEWYFADSISHFPGVVTMLSSGNVIIQNFERYNLDEDIGTDSTAFHFAILTPEGEFVSINTMGLGDANYQLNGMVEMASDTLLLWGCKSENGDINASLTKATVNCEILEEVYFGNPDWADDCFEGVLTENGQIMLAYDFSLYYSDDDIPVREHRIVKVNADDLTTVWEYPLDIPGNSIEYEYGDFVELIAIPNDEFVGLYSWAEWDDTDLQHNYIFKINGDGQLLWWKEIPDVTPGDESFLWNIMMDLESTSDGGFIICGIAESLDEDENLRQNHWLCKLDACGDVQWVDCPVGVPETNGESSLIEIYPNPTSNELKITCDEKMEHIFIEDVSGRKISTETSYSFQSVIDLQKLSVGVYLLRVELENGTIISRKVIKE